MSTEQTSALTPTPQVSYYSFLQFNLSKIDCHYSGVLESISGGECTINEELNLPNDDCIFVADGPSELVSSVLALPYLSGTGQWCDSTEDRLHNADIPTKHNTMCGGSSVLDVVLQSRDFQDYDSTLNISAKDPVFHILQPKSMAQQPYIFILDNSNSMAQKPDHGQKRLDRMKKGIERFMTVDVDMELELPLGVVSFSSKAQTQINHEIISINDEDSRDEIIDTVNGLSHFGNTCLNTGIQLGLEALRNYGQEAGGTAIFLTDGGQYCPGDSDDWLQIISDEVLAQNVRFCTIAMSNAADPDLEEIAKR